ncbi:hypothetical protein [Streptomonospora nanhaiensis]|uniref:hypothetical protein n=1 Tax=Streptomonospora nanhaiensis TaxID=1323731 RepID=UPI001C38FCE2|nr:hypothetical protein [Streptomonospora nanhaiensis]MBV2364492.1 hypothetical protein [Streptomonospora nanhaiensis]
MAETLEYRALLALDIERSSGRGNVALRRIRAVLAAALREALERSGIAWSACVHDDLGDGLRVAAPAGLPKAALVHPLVRELAVRLRAHNRAAAPGTAVRVRAALHAGEVYVGGAGGAGVTGGPLEVLARLLDAPVLKTALAQAPESVSVALLMSRHFHEETVRHGYPGIDPDAFHQVAFTTKEYSAEAWLHLAPDAPGAPRPVPAGPAAADAPGADPAPGPTPGEGAGPGASTMVNTATGNGAVFAVQHGTQHVHRPHGR